MTSLAPPPAPSSALGPAPPPKTPARGRSLLHKMIERYFSLPQVKSWLMQRHPRPVKNAHALNTSFSYACMYYAPSFVPRGMDRYPLQKPFLDIGDFLLCHHVYDGVAVGTLFNNKEEHALSIVRDSVLKDKNVRLSRRPRTRNFAVDLRVKQLEVVEFAWMEDDSLIIACRQLVDSNSEERRFVLSADMLYFEPIPQNCGLDMCYMLLAMTLRERTVICDFCGAQGYQSCACPNSLKRKAPTRTNSPSDAVFPVRDGRNEPTGSLASAIGSWENYTDYVFSCSQTGSFFISSRRRSANGGMEKFPGPKYPIQYRFVCGQRSDTVDLARLYVRKMRLCQRSLAADTYLYGGGLSRRSDIGMLMDKEDEKPQQGIDDLPLTECNGSIFKEGDMLSNDVSTHIGAGTVLSQTTSSQVTMPSDEYGQFFTQIDMPPGMAPLQSQCTEEVSLLSTRLSEDSPTSTLLDREDALTGTSFIDMHEVPSDRPCHVMYNAYNEGNNSQTTVAVNVNPIPVQPRPLSTTSRELQAFMTVDESGTPKCTECGSSFQKRGNLARHVQTVHLKLKPFQCDQCSARFGYKTHLKRHKSVHQRGNEFRCNVCNRDFRGQLKLNRHLQQAHQQQAVQGDGDNRIVCDVCGVSFSQMSNLSRHMQIHQGLRFFCPVCPNRLSSFGQKHDLQRHIKRKHPGYSEAIAASLVPEKAEPLV